MPERVLITGGRGMLASYLSHTRDNDVLCAIRNELDIRNGEAFREYVLVNKVTAVINAAGLVGTGDAGNALLIYTVNALSPYHMASICRELDILFVFISSTRVFDGTKDNPYLESDNTNPLDDYGLSKLLGEDLVKNVMHDGRYYIIRLPQILGIRKRNEDSLILYRLWKNARETGKIHVATDMYNSFSYASDIASMTWDLIENKKSYGLYHLTNDGKASLFDLATYVFKLLNLNVEIIPVTHDFFGEEKRKARCLAISSEKIKPGRHWKLAIKDFVEEWKAHIDEK
ncbi:MAG: NAD(P)-dependent oxidoreductase [Deltaproteobacteria bacterium]|nr:NAD(P)-dependent oxidoreductase [Deltaproteobacteria bacterium]